MISGSNGRRAPDLDRVDYILVETVLRVSADIKEVFRGSDISSSREIENVSIDLVHRGDASAGKTVCLPGNGVSWNVSCRDDGTLSSICNSTSPPGPAVVRGATRILRIAGSIAAMVSGAGGAASPGARRISPTDDTTHQQDHSLESSLELAGQLANRQRDKLNEIRNLVVDTVSGSLASTEHQARIAALSKAERIVERSLDATQQEIERLTSIQQLRRQRLEKTVVYRLERYIPIADIPTVSVNDADKVPRRSQDGGDVLEKEFNLIARRIEPDRTSSEENVRLPADGSAYIEWREPRQVQIIIWREIVEGQRRAINRLTVPVVDSTSKRRFFEFDTSGWFRSENAKLTFGDSGTPQALGLNRASAVSAISDALGEAMPEAVKTMDSIGASLQGRAERRQKAAQRAQADLDAQIAHERSRLELLGLNATAADFAELRKIEQAAAMARARQVIEGNAQ